MPAFNRLLAVGLLASSVALASGARPYGGTLKLVSAERKPALDAARRDRDEALAGIVRRHLPRPLGLRIRIAEERNGQLELAADSVSAGHQYRMPIVTGEQPAVEIEAKQTGKPAETVQNARCVRPLQERQELLHAIDHLDHVGARLPLHVHDHRGHVVHPRGELHVLGPFRHELQVFGGFALLVERFEERDLPALAVLLDLAKQIVMDGEGATKLVEIRTRVQEEKAAADARRTELLAE